MKRILISHWVTAGIVLATAVILLGMGRATICECGTIKLFYFQTGTSKGSQHLFDWYSPSHVLHGFIFYAALWLFARRVPMGWQLAIATLVEAAWEIVDNTDAIINRYREATIALDYYGDSIVNSRADIAAMFLGFWLFKTVPVWASVLIIIIAEVVVIYAIRDGLALNVLMLLYPVEAVKVWQRG